MSSKLSSPRPSSRGSSVPGRGRSHTLVSSPNGSRASSSASQLRLTTVSKKEAEAREIVRSYGGQTKKLLADIRRARDRLLAVACQQGKSHNIVVVADGVQHQQKVTKEIVTLTGAFLHMLETMAKKRGPSRVSAQKAGEREGLLGHTDEWGQIAGYVSSTTSYSPVHVLDSFTNLLSAISAGMQGAEKGAFNSALEYIRRHNVSTRDTVQYLCSFIKYMGLDRERGYYVVNGNLLAAFNQKIVDDATAGRIAKYLSTVDDSKKSKLLREFPAWRNQTLFKYLQERPRPSGKGEMLAKVVGGKHYVSTSAGFTIAVICTVPLSALDENDADHIAKAILSAVNVKAGKEGGAPLVTSRVSSVRSALGSAMRMVMGGSAAPAPTSARTAGRRRGRGQQERK